MLLRKISIALVAGLVVGAGVGLATFLANSGPQRKAAAENDEKATNAFERLVNADNLSSELQGELRRTTEEVNKETIRIRGELASIRSDSFKKASVYALAAFIILLVYQLRRRKTPAGSGGA